MPTSSLNKEIIITDVKAFIRALEKSKEWNEHNGLKPVEHHVVTREEIRELFGGDAN